MSRHVILVVATLLLAAGRAGAADVEIIPQHSGVEVRLRGISAVSADVAWASGRGGTVLRTIDGGAHWQAIRVPGAEALDFRDIEGFDADTAVALSIGPGEASRIYRTDDAGRTWRLALQNHDPEAFFDCMAFDGDQGWLLGDPVDGRFQVYRSTDAGRHWVRPELDMPPAEKDEAAFAASGTCIAHAPWGEQLAVSGGAAARVFVGDSGGRHWRAYRTTMPSRIPAGGIFSAAGMGRDVLLVGGDFEHETAAGSAARVRFESGHGLVVEPLPSPPGYRSGAACTTGDAPVCVAVGPGGADALIDGRWRAVTGTGYDAVDMAGHAGWASGDKGRIARVVFRGD